MAETTYIFNVYKKAFTTLVQQNRNHSKEAIFLHEIHGGLNIKDLEAHKIAMRIKHIPNLKQQENPPSWRYLAINPSLLLRFH